jgi:3',5'-cyclic AMP phosphodiesterase CpdA
MHKHFRTVTEAGVLIFVAATASCGNIDQGIPLASRTLMPDGTEAYELIARLVHVSDTHVVDEESPARLAGAGWVSGGAWRPWEAYAAQIFDGIVRTVNNMHASGRPIDFVIHTGDACDNVQGVELDWFLNVWDGVEVDPLTGPDDRKMSERPPALLDPHATFQPQGLYREDVHGSLPSIPWYVVFGNHDVFAAGTFPILESIHGARFAPMPLNGRPGLLIPTVLDPLSQFSHGRITPADPGPVPALTFESYVAPNRDRAFFNHREFIRAMFTTVTGPDGHGFEHPEHSPSWYSVSPVAGVRLIGLDTCDHPVPITGTPQHDGAISDAQLGFLKRELRAADEAGEIVIVASHHPGSTLNPWYGSAILADDFRRLLNDHESVLLHLAGHLHRNRVWNRGNYWEIETCSTIDLPQEARLIEIYRSNADGSIAVAYDMFSHIDDRFPKIEDDPLRQQRAAAETLAIQDANTRQRNRSSTTNPITTQGNARGNRKDRQGMIFKGPCFPD